MSSGVHNRIHSAILAVALNQYVLNRAKRRERVTDVAAERIATIARREFKLSVECDPRLHGFTLDGNIVQPLSPTFALAVVRLVDESDVMHMVHRLYNRFH